MLPKKRSAEEREALFRGWEVGPESGGRRTIGVRYSKELQRLTVCILSESYPHPMNIGRLPEGFIPREEIRDEKLLQQMEDIVEHQMQALKKGSPKPRGNNAPVATEARKRKQQEQRERAKKTWWEPATKEALRLAAEQGKPLRRPALLEIIHAQPGGEENCKSSRCALFEEFRAFLPDDVVDRKNLANK